MAWETNTQPTSAWNEWIKRISSFAKLQLPQMYQIIMLLIGLKMHYFNCSDSFAKPIQICNNSDANNKNNIDINVIITVQPESQIATKYNSYTTYDSGQ